MKEEENIYPKLDKYEVCPYYLTEYANTENGSKIIGSNPFEFIDPEALKKHIQENNKAKLQEDILHTIDGIHNILLNAGIRFNQEVKLDIYGQDNSSEFNNDLRKQILPMAYHLVLNQGITSKDKIKKYDIRSAIKAVREQQKKKSQERPKIFPINTGDICNFKEHCSGCQMI